MTTETHDAAGIRVWLEPGYDQGRTGAWLLDWPGAFTWGPDRRAALARVQSAASRHLGWLAAHGEPAEAPLNDRAEVAEEVAPTRLPDGYERMATFTVDADPVTASDLETAIRRLGHARTDLLALRDRVRAFERAGGVLPREDRTGDVPEANVAGRDHDEVLRHVAGSEIWLASRLDRSFRYERDRDVDPVADLEGTRAWLVERLHDLWARDAALAGTDGKGETWTLRKVLRRLLYHSLDHLQELDRRLAIAEGRAERLELRIAPPDLDQLIGLLARAGFQGRTTDRERLARSIGGTARSYTLWDGERLVAFARLITDGAWFGHISSVAVAPEWQGFGVGERLMRAILDGHDGISMVLGAREGVEPFYERLGFAPQPWLMARRRID